MRSQPSPPFLTQTAAMSLSQLPGIQRWDHSPLPGGEGDPAWRDRVRGLLWQGCQKTRLGMSEVSRTKAFCSVLLTSLPFLYDKQAVSFWICDFGLVMRPLSVVLSPLWGLDLES